MSWLCNIGIHNFRYFDKTFTVERNKTLEKVTISYKQCKRCNSLYKRIDGYTSYWREMNLDHD